MGTEIYFYKKKHKIEDGEILKYGDILLKMQNEPHCGQYLLISDPTIRVVLSNSSNVTKICDKLQEGDKLQQTSNGIVCTVHKLEKEGCLLDTNNRRFFIPYSHLYTDIYKEKTRVISNNTISLIQKLKRGRIYIQDSIEVMYLSGWSDMKMKFLIKARNTKMEWDYHKMEDAIKRGIITEFPVPTVGSNVVCHSENAACKIVKMDEDTVLFDTKEIGMMHPLIFLNRIKSKSIEVCNKKPFVSINVVGPEVRNDFNRSMVNIKNRIGILDHDTVNWSPSFKNLNIGAIDPSGKSDMLDAIAFAMNSSILPLSLNSSAGSGKTMSFAESREINRSEFTNELEKENPICVSNQNVEIESKKKSKTNEAWECPFKLPLFTESNIVGKSQKEKVKANIQQSY